MSLPGLLHRRNLIFWAVVWQLFFGVTALLVKAVDGDITSSRMSCSPGTTLRIGNLTALGADFLPQKTDSGDPVRCDELVAAENTIRNQCENETECSVDLGALHLTKAICPNTSYVSLNCFCMASDGTKSLVEERTSEVVVPKSVDDKRAAPAAPPGAAPGAAPVAAPPAAPPAEVPNQQVVGGAANNQAAGTITDSDLLNALHGIQGSLNSARGNGLIKEPTVSGAKNTLTELLKSLSDILPKALFGAQNTDASLTDVAGKNTVGEILKVLKDMEQHFSGNAGNVKLNNGSMRATEEMTVSVDVPNKNAKELPTLLAELRASVNPAPKDKNAEILKALKELKNSLDDKEELVQPSVDDQIRKLVDEIEESLNPKPADIPPSIDDSTAGVQDEIVKMLNGIQKTLDVLAKNSDTDALKSLTGVQKSLNRKDEENELFTPSVDEKETEDFSEPDKQRSELDTEELAPSKPLKVQKEVLKTLSGIGKSLLRTNQFLRQMHKSLQEMKEKRKKHHKSKIMSSAESDLADAFSDITVLERENAGNIIDAMRKERKPTQNENRKEKAIQTEESAKSEISVANKDKKKTNRKVADMDSEKLLDQLTRLLQYRLRNYEARRKLQRGKKAKELRNLRRGRLRNKKTGRRRLRQERGLMLLKAEEPKKSGPGGYSPPRLLKVSKAEYMKELKAAELAAKEEELMDARLRKVQAERRKKSEAERMKKFIAEQTRKLQDKLQRELEAEQRRKLQTIQWRKLDAQLMKTLKAEQLGAERRGKKLGARSQGKSQAEPLGSTRAEKRETVQRRRDSAIRRRNLLRKLNDKVRRRNRKSTQSENGKFEVRFHKVNNRINHKLRQANRAQRHISENYEQKSERNTRDAQQMKYNKQKQTENRKWTSKEVTGNKVRKRLDDRVKRYHTDSFKPERSKSPNEFQTNNASLTKMKTVDGENLRFKEKRSNELSQKKHHLKNFKQDVKRSSAENLKYGHEKQKADQRRNKIWTSSNRGQVGKDRERSARLNKVYSRKQRNQDLDYRREKQRRSGYYTAEQEKDFEQMMNAISSRGMFESGTNKQRSNDDNRFARHEYPNGTRLHAKTHIRDQETATKARLYGSANDLLAYMNHVLERSSSEHGNKFARGRHKNYGQNDRRMGRNFKYDWNRQHEKKQRRNGKLKLKWKQKMRDRDLDLESRERRKRYVQMMNEQRRRKHLLNRQLLMNNKYRTDKRLRNRSFRESRKGQRMRNQLRRARQLKDKSTRKHNRNTEDYRTNGEVATRRERQLSSQDKRLNAENWRGKWNSLSDRAHQGDYKHQSLLQRHRLQFEDTSTSLDDDFQSDRQDLRELGNTSIARSNSGQLKESVWASHEGKSSRTLRPEKLLKRHKSYLENDERRRENDHLDVHESRINRDESHGLDQIEVYRLMQKRNRGMLGYNSHEKNPIPGVETFNYVCSGSNCVTVTKSLGLPIRELTGTKDALVVAHDELLLVPASRKRWKIRPYPCKRIKQKAETYMKDLENWQICHLRGHIPPDVMSMIRNNYFVVVTRMHEEEDGRRMILVQKDDSRITNEIIQRILHGFEGRKALLSMGGKSAGDGEFEEIEEAFEEPGQFKEFNHDKVVLGGENSTSNGSGGIGGGVGGPTVGGGVSGSIGEGLVPPFSGSAGAGSGGMPPFSGSAGSGGIPPFSGGGGNGTNGVPPFSGGGGNGTNGAPPFSGGVVSIGGPLSIEGGVPTSTGEAPSNLNKAAAAGGTGEGKTIEKWSVQDGGQIEANAATLVCTPTDRPCLNNGVCKLSSDNKTSKCFCSFGYFGDRCEIKPTQCSSNQSNLCQNGGTCVEANGYAHCVCSSKFSGSACEMKQVIPCSTSPCRNGSACRDTPEGFVCSCPPERKGEKCEVSATTCPSDRSPCNVGGVCVPIEGDNFLCLCDAHHYGPTCSSVFDTCKSPGLCKNGGTCLTSAPEGSNATAPNAKPFRCVCPPGQTGELCETKTDPCVGTSVCLNGGTCVVAANAQGFMCECAPPHKGPQCEDGAVAMLSRTLLVDGAKRGTCDNGLCQNGGSCFLSTDGEKVCVCLQGYGGAHCENWEDTCSSGPCLNGGSCYNTGSGQFKCNCLPGFFGTNCQRSQAACTPDTCLNNGVCRPAKITTGFVCICPEGYGGITCDVKDPCLSHPCQNGALCRIYSEGKLFRCECSGGFSGNLCETRNAAVDSASSPCSSVPCLNGGTCKETNSDHKGFTCICLPGVKGKTCEKDAKDDCKSLPCVNGGICKNYPGGFKCSCPYGLEGITCEKKLFVDPCDKKPCENGGLCKMINTIAFECLCPLIYTGPNCTVYTAPCKQRSNPCAAGKMCVENPTSFVMSYLCVDEKIQSNPSGNYSWKFVNFNNMSREELLKSQMFGEPVLTSSSLSNYTETPAGMEVMEAARSEVTESSKKKWKMGKTEIVILVVVGLLLLLGIILCIFLYYKARQKSMMDQGNIYRPISTRNPTTGNSFDNLLSTYHDRHEARAEAMARTREPRYTTLNQNQNQNQSQIMQTIPEDDEEDEEEDAATGGASQNVNNSAGSYWSTVDNLLEGPEVFLVQPLPEQDQDPVRQDGGDVGSSSPISDACRYALLERVYAKFYGGKPQLQMTPPKQLSDEFLVERRRLGIKRRVVAIADDGFSSVELLPPSHPP